MKEIKIYTDGSCLGNPGPGGYGAILIYKKNEKEIYDGFFNTTNNRMELMAPIMALSKLKEPCNVKIITDSKYVKNGITSWIFNWKKNNWKTASKKDVKNKDLWQKLDNVLNKHNVTWEWVKAHNGHPENERCDALAKKGALSPSKKDL